MKTGKSHRECRADGEAGFTVFEILIVFMISALMIAAVASLYSQWISHYRIAATRARIETIKEALEAFIQAQGRLPCPAPLTAGPGDPGYLTEECGGGGGVFDDAGWSLGPPGTVRIGAIPARTLTEGQENVEVSATDTFDGWDNRFTFAVRLEMTNSAGFNANNGNIRVDDPDGGASVVQPGNPAIYFIVSHGPNRAGAYSSAGVQGIPCPGAADDRGNCDNDSDFIYSVVTDTSAGGYDDMAAFSTKSSSQIESIAAYYSETLPCNIAVNQAAINHIAAGSLPLLPPPPPDPTRVGEATAQMTVDDVQLTNAEVLGGARNKLLVYSTTRTATVEGSIIIRVSMPIRYTPRIGPPIAPPPLLRWSDSIMAAVYVDNGDGTGSNYVGSGLVIDPMAELSGSRGATGLLAVEANIRKGLAYTVSIYAYSIGDSSEDGSYVGPWDMDGDGTGGDPDDVIGYTAWAGCIRLIDHAMDAVVEIFEKGV